MTRGDCTCNICTMIDLSRINGFEWDEGNTDKSFKKHGITPKESEEVFLDEDLKVETDLKHQQREIRDIAIGKTFGGEILFVVFTTRNRMIRIISARIANKKERRVYEKNLKTNSKI